MSVNIFWVKMCTCIVFISPEVFANFLLSWSEESRRHQVSLSLSLLYFVILPLLPSFSFLPLEEESSEERERERERDFQSHRKKVHSFSFLLLLLFFFLYFIPNLFFTSLPDSLVVSLKEVVLNEETTKSTKWRIRRNTILPVPSLFPSLFDRKIGWYTMSVGSQQPTQLFHASVSCRVTRFPCFFLHQISRPKLLSRSL